jgi:hypothetical protein
VIFSDWRQIDGMTLPYSEEMTAGPVTILGQVTEVQFDEKMDPRMFALPKTAGGAKAPVKAAKQAPEPEELRGVEPPIKP